jgi:hypothetical protein
MKAHISPFPPGATTSVLNKLIPYGSIYIPADGMSPGTGLAEPYFQNKQINAQYTCYDVYEMPKGNDTFVFWSIPFHLFPLDIANPDIIVMPEWFQDADETAPDPTEYIYWEIGLANTHQENTLDLNIFNTSKKWQSPVLDAWKLQVGGISGPLVGAKTTAAQIDGDTLTASDYNFIHFGLEREQSEAEDTYQESIYLKGVNIQYKIDFNNIGQWASI